MATYVLPQVLVFQDFQVVPSAVANPLRAHISGGHAYLSRFADEEEQPLGEIGYYDRISDVSVLWPSRPAGADIDEPYTKLFIKDALLHYYADDFAGGDTLTKLTNYNNRVHSAARNFSTNGTAYPRHSSFLDRDVTVGDVVKVRAVDTDGDTVELWSYIKDIVGDDVVATIASATEDAANKSVTDSGQAAAVAVTQDAGDENCVVLTADATDYDGYTSGDIDETYTVTVLEGSLNGDYTVAELRITSATGNDDVLSVAPAATGVDFEVGTHGLLINFSDVDTAACSASADADSVSYNDLISGQVWTLVVADAVDVAIAPTSGGTYTGTNDTTYIVEVSRGGKFSLVTTDSPDQPTISVTTTNGIDLSGPTEITAATTDFDIGTRGVAIQFAGDGLIKGDKYYVVVTGVAEGPMRNLVLGHNINEDVAAGAEVAIDLFIRKPELQVAENRTGFAPMVNWEQSDTEFTTKSGIIAYDDTWTDSGVPQALDIWSEMSKKYGRMYVEYRAWQSGLCEELHGIDDVGDLNEQISGALDPDNPLKWGVFKALENAGGVEVKWSCVADPTDADEWASMLDHVQGRDDVYGLVPLTKMRTAQDLIVANVNSQSSPEQALWRVAWLSLEGVPEIPLVHSGSTLPGYLEPSTSDGDEALAVVEDDPNTSGTQYTIVRVAAGNADFETNGVRGGDILRILYTGDGFGNYEYSEYVVDEVHSEDQLRLISGLGAAVTVAAKIEIWRNLGATEEAAEIAKDAGSWGNRRVRAVWPDRVESGGTLQEGFHLAAALAGLSSGVLPQQGLTNVEISGFSDVPRTTAKFNRSQLDNMALGGTYIVTQDPVNGNIYSRHAVSTGNYDDIHDREEMVTRNVDSISFRFKDHFAPFIGRTNVVPSMQLTLEVEVKNLVGELRHEINPQLGGQLVSASIRELRQHTLLKDRFVLILDCVIPYPFNNFEIHLVI